MYWKTSAPEHVGPDSDCVPILRFLGMNLERVNEERSEELNLPVGSIPIEPDGIRHRSADEVRAQLTAEDSYYSRESGNPLRVLLRTLMMNRQFKSIYSPFRPLQPMISLKSTRPRPVAQKSTIILIKLLSIFQL